MKPKPLHLTWTSRLALCLIYAGSFWLTGCASHTPDPLAGWTSRTFDDFLPRSQKHHYQLDAAITHDYQDFIKEKHLFVMGAIEGFFEDGTGRHTVLLEACPPGKNDTWKYALIYDSQNRRTKVIKYGHQRYRC
jgi:hypothetical protein